MSGVFNLSSFPSQFISFLSHFVVKKNLENFYFCCIDFHEHSQKVKLNQLINKSQDTQLRQTKVKNENQNSF